MTKNLRVWAFGLILVWGVALMAVPTVVITGVGESKTSLSTTVRTDGSPGAGLFMSVLKDNLRRSGWFTVSEGTGGGVRIMGTVSTSGGQCVANLTLQDARGNSYPWKKSCRPVADEVRPMAHELNDLIVERVTGKPGMASAPIIFVGKRGNTDIWTCDADGGRLRQVTTEGALCLSPKWLPDRSGFLYTRYTGKRSGTYRATFRRGGGVSFDTLTAFPGLNAGAVPSPEGREAAMVLSVSGNVELYAMNLSSKKLNRITFTPNANEASPCWSPSGSQLAYVSDVSGAPQVYVVAKGSRNGTRAVNVRGMSESTSPDWGLDGRIAFCGRKDGTYGIYTTRSGEMPVQVSPKDGGRYEDPSWAPDGRHIVCTRTAGGRRSLLVLDTMGDSPIELFSVSGNWYLADWAR